MGRSGCLSWRPRRRQRTVKVSEGNGEASGDEPAPGKRQARVTFTEETEIEDTAQEPTRAGNDNVEAADSREATTSPRDDRPGPELRVDLGPGRDFRLEAKFSTTQRDTAIAGKLMPRELYTPQSSPRGGRKLLVVREGRLSWEVAGRGELHGTRSVCDGLVHEVCVSYSAEKDRFTLIVDGLEERSGLCNIEDHTDCKFAVGSSERMPAWSADAAFTRFDTAAGAIAEVRWNGQLLHRGSDGSRCKPAYLQGQMVEYFSRTHKLWLSAEILVKVLAPRPGSEWAVYSALLRGTRQRRSNVGLSCLRLPLEPAEPCEFYLEEEDCWLPAQVRGALLDAAQPTYELYLEKQAAGDPPCEASGVLVRRRFPDGCRVLVYRGIGRGWVPATVAAAPDEGGGRLPEAADTEDEFELGAPVGGPLTSDLTVLSGVSTGTMGPIALGSRMEGPREYNWVKVSIREDGQSSWSAVPSYLLRFHKDYLASLAQKLAVRDTVQEALDDLDSDSEPGIDGLDPPKGPAGTQAGSVEQPPRWIVSREVFAI